MSLDRSLDPKRLRNLFRRVGLALRMLSDKELVPIDAANIDLPEAVRKIYGRILPEIDVMIENGVVNKDQLFDLLMEMKVEFDHIQSHLRQAIPALDRLLSAIAQTEKSGGTHSKGGSDTNS